MMNKWRRRRRRRKSRTCLARPPMTTNGQRIFDGACVRSARRCIRSVCSRSARVARPEQLRWPRGRPMPETPRTFGSRTLGVCITPIPCRAPASLRTYELARLRARPRGARGRSEQRQRAEAWHVDCDTLSPRATPAANTQATWQESRKIEPEQKAQAVLSCCAGQMERRLPLWFRRLRAPPKDDFRGKACGCCGPHDRVVGEACVSCGGACLRKKVTGGAAAPHLLATPPTNSAHHHRQG